MDKTNQALAPGQSDTSNADDFVTAWIAGVQKKSAVENKMCNLMYRNHVETSDVETGAEFATLLKSSAEDFRNGTFFMDRIGRIRQVDATLTATLLYLRQQWIQDFNIQSAPEFLLMDMALLSYSHFIRMDCFIGNMESRLEWEFFLQDNPQANLDAYWGKGKFKIEDLVQRVKDRTLPMLDQFNRMFLRNLKAIRDLKRTMTTLNIKNVSNLTVGNQQVNL